MGTRVYTTQWSFREHPLDNAAIGRRLGGAATPARTHTRPTRAAKAVVHWPKITIGHMLYHAETGRRQIWYAEALALATALESSWTLSTLDLTSAADHSWPRGNGAWFVPHSTTGACAITANR